MIARTTTITLATIAILAAGCRSPLAGTPKAKVGEASGETASAAEASTEAAKQAAPAVYAFDGQGSKIGWKAAKVTLTHDGGFKTFAGTIEIPAGEIEKGSVQVEIDLGSVWSDTDQLTGHLKTPDLLDVGTYPKATFVSKGVAKSEAPGFTHELTGTLDFHGVEKSIAFPATIQAGPDSVTVKSEFTMNRKDFGLVYPGMPDDLIRDDVAVKLDVLAKKK